MHTKRCVDDDAANLVYVFYALSPRFNFYPLGRITTEHMGKRN